MFSDPAGQYQFGLPIGWAYDLDKSRLITVMFRPWDRPDETLHVRALPTFAPASSGAEAWYLALEERWFPERMTPLERRTFGAVEEAVR